jgi:hypothetical protein
MIPQQAIDTPGRRRRVECAAGPIANSDLAHFSKYALYFDDLRNHSLGSSKSEQAESALNHFNSLLESCTGILRVRHGVVVGCADKLQEVVLHLSHSDHLEGRAS